MKFDCIIVLANEMDREGNLNLESRKRVELACDSYFDKRSTTLVTCGWNYRKDSELNIGDVLKQYAVKAGVPAENIITELNSRDTVGDAFFTKVNIVSGKGWRKLLVVTSDYHVSRTSNIFRFIYGPQYQIEVIGAAGFDTPEKQASEQKSNAAFNNTFENAEAGNDEVILTRLSTRHPFYNGEIHPKIEIDLKQKSVEN